jgi:DNA-binding response OmpR family regulator
VNCVGGEIALVQALEDRGFRVVQTDEWPADSVVVEYEVIVVVVRLLVSVCQVAARMRVKPRFGHRVLIGISLTSPSTQERRNAIASGFDDIVPESRDSRILIARILRLLRARPEHRCYLPDLKRSAA